MLSPGSSEVQSAVRLLRALEESEKVTLKTIVNC
jgi:hypothetical protein